MKYYVCHLNLWLSFWASSENEQRRSSDSDFLIGKPVKCVFSHNITDSINICSTISFLKMKVPRYEALSSPEHTAIVIVLDLFYFNLSCVAASNTI